MTRTPQRTGLTIPICGSPLKEGEIPGEIKSPIGCAGSVQPKLAVDGANFGRFDQARVRPDLGKHKILDSLIRRSEIFGVEIHSRFDAESIEIGLQPLVGPRAPHAVKMQQKIPISVQSA